MKIVSRNLAACGGFDGLHGVGPRNALALDPTRSGCPRGTNAAREFGGGNVFGGEIVGKLHDPNVSIRVTEVNQIRCILGD